MTTELQFNEDYANPKAEIWTFSAAGNTLLKPTNYSGPIGYYQALKTIKNLANMARLLLIKRRMRNVGLVNCSSDWAISG